MILVITSCGTESIDALQLEVSVVNFWEESRSWFTATQALEAAVPK
jgi:hypothetical protein